MKFKRSFIGILCVLSFILLSGCGANNTDTQSNKQYEYFDVVEMIENGDYDDAIDEMLKAYNDGNYARKIADGIDGTDEEISAKTIIQSINELLEKVSAEKKSEVLTKIDEEIINKYSNEE